MQSEKPQSKIMNFLKPTRVTWVVFIVLLSTMAICLFLIESVGHGPNVQSKVGASIILYILLLPILELYRLVVENNTYNLLPPFAGPTLFLIAMPLWLYVEAFLCSLIWYKFKPKAHTQKPPNG